MDRVAPEVSRCALDRRHGAARGWATPWIWVVGLLAGPGTGCLYTDPINTRPDIRVEKISDGAVARDSDVRLAAVVDDPDGDTVDIDWRVRACSPDERCQDLAYVGLADDDSFIQVHMPERVDDGPAVSLRANAVVTDRYGAESSDMLYLDATNAMPAGALQAAGLPSPFGFAPAGTIVRLTSTVYDPEGDSVDVAWGITPPRNAMPGDYSFEPVGDEAYDYELRADVAGNWIVDLTITDSLGQVGYAEPLVVDIARDAAPCIVYPEAPPEGAFVSLVEGEEGSGFRRFRVQYVTDDLDVYPLPAGADAQKGVTSFAWSLADADSGGAFVPLGGDRADVDLYPDQYTPGDVLFLRVEIADRQARTLPCPVGQPTCSVGDDRDLDGDLVIDACQQRLTWEVRVP